MGLNGARFAQQDGRCSWTLETTSILFLRLASTLLQTLRQSSNQFGT